jgi:energy-coupling factor transporter ATP-binding protein EcfA2
MDPVLRTLLLERLGAGDLDAEARRVIELAVDTGAESAASAPPVWLRSVSVEGFRGIGPEARLELEPSPGLTVVVGRNGSGKSSFAEGLELLMTGALKRWEKRPKAWTETWQCLHHTGPTRLSAELLLEGSSESVGLSQEWPHGAGYGDSSGRAEPAAVLAAHGWDRDLPSFRPFLSYAELATMFDTLSSLYDALAPVLGLADVDELAKRLGEARLAYDNQRKAVAAQKETLLARLDPEDERAALVAGVLGARRPDLDALAELLRDAPEYGAEVAQLRRLAGLAVPTDDEIAAAFEAVRVTERAHADAAGTDAKRATDVASLLRRALAVRDGEDCPVCGTPGVLDDAWAAHAAEHAAALEQHAAALTAAERELGLARRRVEGLLDATARAAPAAARGAGLAVPDEASICEAPPAVLADLPAALDSPEAVLAAAAQLRALSDLAGAELSRRGSAWRELAGQVGAWLDDAREVEQRAGTLKALKEAEKWVKGAAEHLRAERFAPISERAIANWRELRQGSSVDLHEITLKKVGRGGRADFDVRADGDAANALGVMSQGELLALSVSVFLPRAALDESPFRFAVIDDPVQAMDPAKVDGLARVLHRAARTRQIVVFTHDDRLPEAIRRLRLEATMLHVDRRAGSSVDVRVSRSPIQRYLDDARGYAKPGRVPPDVQARVVPGFCRNAVEAAAANIVRRRAVETGGSLEQADEQLTEARTLRETLALALFGDAGRQSDVGPEVSKRYGATAASLVTELNRGAHGDLDATTLKHLPDSTRDFIRELMK